MNRSPHFERWHLWVLMGVAVFCARTSLCAPRLALETDAIDLGVLEESAVTTFSVVFSNRGGSLLLAQAKEPLCCFPIRVLPPARIEVPPGSEGAFSFELDLYPVPSQFHRTLSIETNDPSKPIVRLPVSATFNKPATVFPERLIYRLCRSEQEDRTIFIRFYTPDQQFVGASCPSKALEVYPACFEGFCALQVVLRSDAGLESAGRNTSVVIDLEEHGEFVTHRIPVEIDCGGK